MEEEFVDSCSCVSTTLNLANGGFFEMLDSNSPTCKCHQSLLLNRNEIDYFPKFFTQFFQLTTVDISSNNYHNFPIELCAITTLRVIIAKRNHIDDEGIPEKLSLLVNLEFLDLSGNELQNIPNTITELYSLKELDLGGNKIHIISSRIKYLKKLEVLYLGGNLLSQIPIEFGLLTRLKMLSLSDNKLNCIPESMSNLRNLESLSLHRNQLNALPPGIVKLKRLKELSLRNNPLVRHFVRNFEWQVPSLLELSGRSVLTLPRHYLNYALDNDYELPTSLVNYLQSAHRCANPQCSGVYFSSCVEHIKFKDFCGKFRMPLLAFICSPNCDNYNSSDSSDSDEDIDRVNKVLLG